MSSFLSGRSVCVFLSNRVSSSGGQVCFVTVRVKGGKSLRNGMLNGVRNGKIWRNTIYAGNKLTEERVMFSRQFYKRGSFFDVADY